MMNKRGGDSDVGMGGGKRARGGSKIGLRVMVPSKMAGCLIGKGGQNIENLRFEHKCNIRIPDCPGPERIMEITADDWESVYDCLLAAVPWLYECPNGEDDGSQKELRFLVNQSVVGGIIGKGGEKINDIRNKSGANVKVFQSPAPQSTDRCVQANGTLEKLLIAAREIHIVVQNANPQSMEVPYDPINYDVFFANEYGGYGSGADNRRGPPRGRGGMPMGGRGMPMGRGGPMGGFGMDFEMREPPMMGMRGRGGFRGGFGRGGFDMGFGADEWGGGFSGMGDSGPKLKFSSSEDESTQVTITNDMAGAIIGPGGQRVRKIRNDSKASITISDPDPTTKERVITISGNAGAIKLAQYLLQQSVREHSSGY